MPTYNGTAGADSFTAPDTQDWIINGLGGADALTGGAGNDTIVGGKANDALDGGAGNDIFLIGNGDGIDTILGGADIDVIKATADNVVIGLKSFSGIEEISADGHAAVTISGSSDANTLDFSAVLLTGIASIYGGGGDDVIIGNGQDNVIDGGPGNDNLSGLGGNDIFLFGKGAGFDTIDGGLGTDMIKATADSVVIGLQSFTGIEEISANGFADVRILGTAQDSYMDFSAVTLTGIAQIGGGAGNDTIIGNGQDNVIEGGSGTDTLIGGDGNDTFLIGKGAGFDNFNGGLGIDTIKATADGAIIGLLSMTGIEAITGDGHFSVKIAGTDLDDVLDFTKITLTDIYAIDGGLGNDKITGSVGDDYLYGGDGDDIIKGGAGADNLYGEKGHDILIGDAGDDSFYISSGADIYKGGDGYDTIYANQNGAKLELDKGILSSIEEISANGFFGVTIGGANPDGSYIDLRHVLISEDDIAGINGTAGNDTIFGSFVYDYINGGLGDDMLSGYNGDDVIYGGGGNDILLGGNGYDELHGDSGNDILDGGLWDDIIDGGAGDDTIIISGNPGFDTIDGGKGFDTIVAAAGVSTIKFTSIADIEAISWNGTKVAQIVGGFTDDHFDFSAVALTGIKSIDAGEGNDVIIGSAGNDTILGNAGDDTLIGGIGNDILTGDVGADTLTGGVGADLFEDKALNFQGDTITDFTAEDTIHMLNVKDASKLMLNYQDGVLTVTGYSAFGDGIHINLPGSFTTGNFEAVSDGNSGALIHLIA